MAEMMLVTMTSSMAANEASKGGAADGEVDSKAEVRRCLTVPERVKGVLVVVPGGQCWEMLVREG